MTSPDTKFRMPPQPDGIADDSRDLPDPDRATRRIRAYLTGAGDGLYDTANPGDGPRPLYARDLEAVCRALDDARARESAFRQKVKDLVGWYDPTKEDPTQFRDELWELVTGETG